MPSSLFSEGDMLTEDRTLRLALELSMIGFGDTVQLGSGLGTGLGGALPSVSPPLQTLPASGAAFCPQPLLEDRQKKSQNMTECVPVPSSEHVAEIVGRQGCKIKALRAKTNTYIKTPVRGEEPVFVVTGRKEDVGRAKREILSAAEHFSQIRASRRSSAGAPPGPPAAAPGHVTALVRVPYRVVGLVVGPKGATIKRIQQQTHTYIVTPSRDKEPVFEVTGLPESVEAAQKEIEAHIAVRTGTGTTGSVVGTGSTEESEALGTIGHDYNAYFGRIETTPPAQSCSSSGFSSSGSVSSGSSASGSCVPGLASIWSQAERERDRERDEGLGDSPSFENPAGVWAFSTTRPSPSGSPRGCAVCSERAVTAALVPCGHNLFCLECANGLAIRALPCPACSTPATTAIRIRS